MTNWTKVVTEPLGLTGFALFLVFAFVGKLKSGDKRRWIAPAAMVCAFVALAGGLGLAYLERPRPVPPPAIIAKPQDIERPPAPIVMQKTTGDGSPVVNGAQGDVTITVDQSSGKKRAANPSQDRSKQERK